MSEFFAKAPYLRRLKAFILRFNSYTVKKKWVLAILPTYIVSLLISHAVRLQQDDPWPAPEMLHAVALHSDERRQKEKSPPTIIRYFDTASRALSGKPVILMIHGSPMAGSAVFPKFIDQIKQNGRVLAPDLPGFGYSTRRIDNYSFSAHANHLLQFMDRLQLQKVHLVAYSMGGGAAIEMATLQPDRVASLTLISSIGVQELELLGDYHLNHALHGLQLAVIWVLQELTPHMGMMDRWAINKHYARNFFDSDQRPLRAMLGHLSQPTQIIHGEHDRFVPLAAAREHHRLVPQSRLSTIDGGHLVLFRKTDEIAAMTTQHITDIVDGKGISLSEASPSRIRSASEPFGQLKLPRIGGLQLFIYCTLIALATLISEDLACIGAGMLAARGIMGFIPAALAAFIGIVMGDLMLYGAGRLLGRPAIQRLPLRWFIQSKDVARATQWFTQRGPRIIIASRFLPGSRLPVYFTAGVLGTHLWTFLLYFCLAAALWTPVLVGLAMVTGEAVMSYYTEFQQYALWVVLLAMVILWVSIRMCMRFISIKRRRQ